MKICVTTVVSANHFQYYMPIFIYAINKAFPDVDIKIFLMGKIKKKVRRALEHCRNYEIVENQFLRYKNRASTCNSLRFLLPKKAFLEYDYLYITDIDFLHVPSNMFSVFIKEIETSGVPYAAVGGATSKPFRDSIAPGGWVKEFKRIACGYVMLKVPEWFDKTKAIVKYYNEIVRSGGHDSIDKHPSCSYREYDEVMFARICKKAGLKTPKKKMTFISGEPLNPRYRNIHLGDFKFEKRYSDMKKMRSRITDSTLKKFQLLEKDEVWQGICDIVSEKTEIRVALRRLGKHKKRRVKSLK